MKFYQNKISSLFSQLTSYSKYGKTKTFVPLKSKAAFMLSFLLTTSVLYSSQIQAANNEGWFEIEVILLSQLSDKSALKENFNTTENLLADNGIKKRPKKRKAGKSSAYVHRSGNKTLNLLQAHIKPDISHLKSLLPLCASLGLPFADQQAQLQESLSKYLFEQFQQAGIASFEILATQPPANEGLNVDEFGNPLTTSELNSERNSELGDDNELTEENSVSSEEIFTEASTSENLNEDLSSEINFEQLLAQYQLENTDWLEVIEQNFATSFVITNWTNQPNSAQFYALEKFIPEQMCVWSQPYFDYSQKQGEYAAAQYLDYTVDEMPTLIDGAENPFSESPYLLSSDSLQLHELAQDLKDSRYFKPLLHFGWRQYTLGRRAATPLKIMAGSNINAQYQQAEQEIAAEQQAYQQALKHYYQTLADKGVINNAETDTLEQNSDFETYLSQALTQKKAALIEQHLASIYQELSVNQNSNSEANLEQLTDTQQEPATEQNKLTTADDLANKLNAPALIDEQALIAEIKHNYLVERLKAAHLAELREQEPEPKPEQEPNSSAQHSAVESQSENTLINNTELNGQTELQENQESNIEIDETTLASLQQLAQPPQTPKFTLADKPVQPWFLDGLLTVHVNHYLHVTADFSMLNRASSQNDFIVPSEVATEQKSENENSLFSVRFEQDRRVISKELHYFDHPYMGMLIQIRRYTPPEPELEPDSELVKN